MKRKTYTGEMRVCKGCGREFPVPKSWPKKLFHNAPCYRKWLNDNWRIK